MSLQIIDKDIFFLENRIKTILKILEKELKMATPKKRTGKASQASRRANWKGTIPATTICPNCKAVVLTHTVCPSCGYYKDGFAFNAKKAEEEQKAQEAKKTVKAKTKTEAATEETQEVKKTRKSKAKKAEAEETKTKEVETPAETEE